MNPDTKDKDKGAIYRQLYYLNCEHLRRVNSIEADYLLLELLYDVTIRNRCVINTPIFISLYLQFLQFPSVPQLSMLPLFDSLNYNLWHDYNFPTEVREKTSFYKIVSYWIISFELRSGKLYTIRYQFELVKVFMNKWTKSPLERIVLIEETYEDLKEFIDNYFWKYTVMIDHFEEKGSRLKSDLTQKLKKYKQIYQTHYNQYDAEAVLSMLYMIVSPQLSRFGHKHTFYSTCTYPSHSFPHSQYFVKKCLYFLLGVPYLPSHLQTYTTKMSLIYLQMLKVHNTEYFIHLLRHLMVRTSKAVRYAMVLYFVYFYEYLEAVDNEVIIEYVESMSYFRELIVGRKLIEENMYRTNTTINELGLVLEEMIVPAGTRRAIYFSNYIGSQCIMKLLFQLKENDINLKLSVYNAISCRYNKDMEYKMSIAKTIEMLNTIDGGNIAMFREQVYWKYYRSVSKNLYLRLQRKGLYMLEFDNSYSWMQAKTIKFRLELYRPLSS